MPSLVCFSNWHDDDDHVEQALQSDFFNNASFSLCRSLTSVVKDERRVQVFCLPHLKLLTEIDLQSDVER